MTAAHSNYITTWQVSTSKCMREAATQNYHSAFDVTRTKFI